MLFAIKVINYVHVSHLSSLTPHLSLKESSRINSKNTAEYYQGSRENLDSNKKIINQIE